MVMKSLNERKDYNKKYIKVGEIFTLRQINGNIVYVK
jgi:hypothetical protein